MTAKTHKPMKHKKSVIVLSVILAVVLAFSAAAFIYVKVGEAKLRDKLTFDDNDQTAEDAYGDNAEVFYNGEGYNYNENLVNILCVGVAKKENDKGDRQADALFLLSLDTENDVVNVLSISRNTLTDIDVYDMNNEFMARERNHICLSYTYGKDDEHSSTLTCKAVSRLLYDVPINGYYTLFLDAVSDVVNLVGGVDVVLAEDLTEVNPKWKKGREVTLKGDDALRFVQYRGESNSPRFERQKLFINNFFTTAKKAFKSNIKLPLDMYNKISKNSVTDIDAAQVTYLATEISNARFNMHSIKGKEGFDGVYETFEVDEKALYETVLDLFYIKTN